MKIDSGKAFVCIFKFVDGDGGVVPVDGDGGVVPVDGDGGVASIDWDTLERSAFFPCIFSIFLPISDLFNVSKGIFVTE